MIEVQLLPIQEIVGLLAGYSGSISFWSNSKNSLEGHIHVIRVVNSDPLQRISYVVAPKLHLTQDLDVVEHRGGQVDQRGVVEKVSNEGFVLELALLVDTSAFAQNDAGA